MFGGVYAQCNGEILYRATGLLKTRSAITSVQYSTKGAGNVYDSPQNHSEEL